METITRSEAKASGLIRYFTGKPCRNGHVAERYVVDGKCMACKAEIERRDDYRAKRNAAAVVRYHDNPEPARERSREYKRTHVDQERARRRAYYERKKETIIANSKAYQQRVYTKKQIERATPAWADLDEIRRVYERCDQLNAQMPGTNLRVVHIIPLAGRTVCGLHVAENLKIVSASYELAKSNRFTYAEQSVESDRYLKWLRARG